MSQAGSEGSLFVEPSGRYVSTIHTGPESSLVDYWPARNLSNSLAEIFQRLATKRTLPSLMGGTEILAPSGRIFAPPLSSRRAKTGLSSVSF
jgi:hypothetical protein